MPYRTNDRWRPQQHGAPGLHSIDERVPEAWVPPTHDAAHPVWHPRLMLGFQCALAYFDSQNWRSWPFEYAYHSGHDQDMFREVLQLMRQVPRQGAPPQNQEEHEALQLKAALLAESFLLEYMGLAQFPPWMAGAVASLAFLMSTEWDDLPVELQQSWWAGYTAARMGMPPPAW